MSYASFQIGFWHPFGPHGRESAEDIIERKRSEIEANGWTFWSFQPRKTLRAWQNELLGAKEKSIYVFCSEGRGAIDPARDGSESQPVLCQSYCFTGEDTCQKMPAEIKVPHPFKPGKNHASAFVVQRILFPLEPFDLPKVEWFRGQGHWDQSKVPTRGEYLIRRGGANPMRRARAVLELKSPYLATVSSKAFA